MKVRTLLLGLVAAAATAVSAPAAATAAPADGPITPFVVGGHNATQTYSFMVSLQSNGGHFCGGSLIKANWVVTAKHCVQGKSASSIGVRVGSTNRTSGGSTGKGSRIINHPSADLSLLQLSSNIDQTPVKISSASGPDGTKTRIIGWGQTCAPRGCGGAPTILQELDTSIVADSKCMGINGSSEICTNNPNGNSGACYGDSGGPQIKSVGGTWELIGATSRAGNNNSTCATGPSIYVDVTTFTSWINQNTGSL